jgi:hypothetical protein
MTLLNIEDSNVAAIVIVNTSNEDKTIANFIEESKDLRNKIDGRFNDLCTDEANGIHHDNLDSYFEELTQECSEHIIKARNMFKIDVIENEIIDDMPVMLIEALCSDPITENISSENFIMNIYFE